MNERAFSLFISLQRNENTMDEIRLSETDGFFVGAIRRLHWDSTSSLSELFSHHASEYLFLMLSSPPRSLSFLFGGFRLGAKERIFFGIASSSSSLLTLLRRLPLCTVRFFLYFQRKTSRRGGETNTVVDYQNTLADSSPK